MVTRAFGARGWSLVSRSRCGARGHALSPSSLHQRHRGAGWMPERSAAPSVSRPPAPLASRRQIRSRVPSGRSSNWTCWRDQSQDRCVVAWLPVPSCRSPGTTPMPRTGRWVRDPRVHVFVPPLVGRTPGESARLTPRVAALPHPAAAWPAWPARPASVALVVIDPAQVRQASIDVSQCPTHAGRDRCGPDAESR